MFNKAIGFLSTFSFYIISAIIVALILINMFIPNKYPSKETFNLNPNNIYSLSKKFNEDLR